MSLIGALHTHSIRAQTLEKNRILTLFRWIAVCPALMEPWRRYKSMLLNVP